MGAVSGLSGSPIAPAAGLATGNPLIMAAAAPQVLGAVQSASDPTAGLLPKLVGNAGTGIPGPEAATIQNPVTSDQVNQATTGAQATLAQQQALLAALQGQKGIQNQSNVFNQGQQLAGQMAQANGIGNQVGAMSQQQALNSGLAANNGAANVGQVYGQGQQLAGQLAGANAVQNQSGALAAQQQLAQQQQALAGQYGQVAAGQGPNPAQAMLNNATGQNVAQQAALMAGQRGAGANAGLIARQAAQQGAGIQQNAVGQAAQMQAQQQLAAMQGQAAQQQAIGATQQNVAGIAGQQLAAQQAQQAALAGQAAQQVGMQQTGIGAQGALSGQQIAQQQAQQQALASQAANQVGQQAGATTAANQAAQNEQNVLLGGVGAQNQANVGMQGNINSANTALGTTTMQGKQALIGGLGNAAGAATGLFKADGGEIEKMAAGGVTAAPIAPLPVPPSYADFMAGWSGPQRGSDEIGAFENMNDQNQSGTKSMDQGFKKLGAALGKAKGGLANNGGHVAAKNPSQKAVKSGNSYDNDKIPAMLSEHEVVIPREVILGPDPINNSAKFVAKTLAKGGLR